MKICRANKSPLIPADVGPVRRETRQPGGRRFAWAFVACLLSPSAFAAQAEPRQVRDLHYGEVLFYFYQQKYFTAITHLGTSEHYDRISHHRDDAELLRGGLYLSYGLHNEAAQIFERLIEQGAPPLVRNRAWFYLAKIRYQRGYLTEAEESLAEIEGPLPADVADEQEVLAALLLMTRHEYSKAADRLKRVPPKSEWALYARYNLGIALIKSSEFDAGVQLLDEIGQQPATGEEHRALKDKANVALAYSYLQREIPVKARGYLERVRLDGYLSNKALLGMGWAHSALGDDREALVPWLELHGRNPFDAAVQEALLAVPYAYGRLGAHAQSLKHYEDAIAIYDAEMKRIGESIKAIRTGKLSENILRNDPGDDMGWFWHLQGLPDAPESRYLVQLLATHDFQEAFKNYRDLRFMAANLAQGSENIDIFGDMLTTRRKGFEERLPTVLNAAHDADFDRMRERHELYTQELTRIEQNGDTDALANERERALQDWSKRAGEIVRRLPDTADMRDVREKYRLLRGLLISDIAKDYSVRLWEAKKSLRAIEAEIATAAARRAALAGAQREMSKTFAGHARRIKELRARIEKIQGRLAVVAVEQELVIEALAVTALEQQRARIATYVTQARFAVAQIYDQATGRTEGQAQ